MPRIATRAAALALLLAAAPPAAADNERTGLEFDRMRGTEYPSEQKLRGESYTLASIYAAARVELEVVEGDDDIAPLTGDDGEPAECITNAELDALEAEHRESPIPPGKCNDDGEDCRLSFAYGVVVDHFAANSPDDCRSGVLGRMWDSEERGAFAIYYKNNTIQTNGQKYLRTTAHELGHAFNLHHEDGDGETTIMNQTSVVGNDFTYDFSEHSGRHLDSHLDDCNRPGTGAFYGVDEEHADWHSSTHLACPGESAGTDDGDGTVSEGEENR